MASPAEIRKLIQDLKKVADTSKDFSSAFEKVERILRSTSPLLQSQVQALAQLASKSRPIETALSRLSQKYGEVGRKAKDVIDISKRLTSELGKQVTLADKLVKSLKQASNINTNPGPSNNSNRSPSPNRRKSNKPSVFDTSALERQMRKQTDLLEKIFKNDKRYYSKRRYYRKKDKYGKSSKRDRTRDYSYENYDYSDYGYKRPGVRRTLAGLGDTYEIIKNESQFEFGEERRRLADRIGGFSKAVSEFREKRAKSRKEKKTNEKVSQEQSTIPPTTETKREVRGEMLGSQGIEGVVLEVGRSIVDALMEIKECMNCGKLIKDDRLKGTGYRRSKTGQTASWAEVDRELRRQRLFAEAKNETVDSPEPKKRKSFLKDLTESGKNALGGGGMFAVPFMLANEALGFMVKLLDEIGRPIKEITAEYGMSAKQAKQLSGVARAIFTNTEGTVASLKDLREVAGETSRIYESLILKPEYFEGGVAKLAEVAKYTGLSSAEMAQFSELMRRQGGKQSAEMAANFTETAVQAAETAGIAPGILTRDIMKNAGRLTAHFAGSREEIMNSTVEIRKMGYTLDEAFSLEDNLLDFEKSTQAALEASVALGRNIDLTAARTALLQEGPEGMVRELRKLMTGKEFEQLGYAQRRIFSDMLGMPVDEVQKKLYMTAQDFEDMTAGSTEKAKADIDSQTPGSIFGSLNQYFPMDEIRNSFDKLKQTILTTAEPSILRFGTTLSNFSGKLEGSMGTVVKKMSEFGAKGLDFISDVLSGQLNPLQAVADAFTEHVLVPLRDFIREDILGLSAFSGLTTEQQQRVNARNTAADAAASMPGVPGLPNIGIGARIWAGIMNGFEYLKDQNPDIKDGGQVNDGIVQNGRIITTHPQDYVMAIKNPNSLDQISNTDVQKMAAMEITLKDILSTLRASRDTPSVHYIDFGDGAVEKLNSRLRLVNTNYS